MYVDTELTRKIYTYWVNLACIVKPAKSRPWINDNTVYFANQT